MESYQRRENIFQRYPLHCHADLRHHGLIYSRVHPKVVDCNCIWKVLKIRSVVIAKVPLMATVSLRYYLLTFFCAIGSLNVKSDSLYWVIDFYLCNCWRNTNKEWNDSTFDLTCIKVSTCGWSLTFMSLLLKESLLGYSLGFHSAL